MPSRIDGNLAERVKLFHGHGELFAEQIHQSRDPRGAASHADALDVFAAGGGAEEIKGLLDLQGEDVRNRAEHLLALLFGDTGDGFTLLEALGVLEIKVQLLLQGVGVLIAADRDVAGKGEYRREQY